MIRRAMADLTEIHRKAAMFLSTPRRFPRSLAALALVASLASACSDEKAEWHGTNVTGSVPDLSFTMTRASDGKEVSAEDFEGKATLLYFGYTFCPDVCPLTLANIAQALKAMGEDAREVRVLFVTVDPDRDTPDLLKDYTDAFAPQMVGLRGTDNQLASLAKRYRVAYSVDPDENGEYVVTHSPAVYAFNGEGEARVLFTGLSRADADTKGLQADLERLVNGGDEGGGLLSWL